MACRGYFDGQTLNGDECSWGTTSGEAIFFSFFQKTRIPCKPTESRRWFVVCGNDSLGIARQNSVKQSYIHTHCSIQSRHPRPRLMTCSPRAPGGVCISRSLVQVQMLQPARADSADHEAPDHMHVVVFSIQ